MRFAPGQDENVFGFCAFNSDLRIIGKDGGNPVLQLFYLNITGELHSHEKFTCERIYKFVVGNDIQFVSEKDRGNVMDQPDTGRYTESEEYVTFWVHHRMFRQQCQSFLSRSRFEAALLYAASLTGICRKAKL